MPWTPTEGQLGTYTQSAGVSQTIQYYDISYTPGGVDPTTGDPTPGEEIRTYYPVRITANETNPSSIVISSNDTVKTATIAGVYGPVFNDTVRAMKTDKSIIELNTMTTPPIGTSVWSKLAQYDVEEVLSFIADSSRERTFTYTAKAGNIVNGVMTVVSTATFTILLSDRSWSAGRDALIAAVAATRG